MLVAARAAGRSAPALLRRNDVVDAQDHARDLGRRAERLALDAQRLDDVELPHIGRLPVLQVDPGVLVRVRSVVGAPEVDQGVDRVVPTVLGEGPRDALERLSERLDRQLLAATDGARPLAQLHREVDLGRAAAGADDPVLDDARDDLEGIVQRALHLLGDVLGAAPDQDRDGPRVGAARDERHLVLADLALIDLRGGTEVRGGELLDPGDDLTAGRTGELLEVRLLDLLHAVDALLREVVEDDIIDPLLADDHVRPDRFDRVDHLVERPVFLFEEALDLVRVLDVDLALDFRLLDLERGVEEDDLRVRHLGGHAWVAPLLVEDDPLDELGVRDRASVALLDLDLVDVANRFAAAHLGDLLDREDGDLRELGP